MNIPYVMKRCSKCGEWLVANSVNFRKDKRLKCGLRANCKTCEKAYKKKYRKENKEQISAYNKEYYEQNKDKCNEWSKKYQKKHKEQIQEYVKKYYEEHKEQIREKQKEYWTGYYENNKEQLSKKNKTWRKQNEEWLTEYYEQNKDKITEQHKKYYEQNKEQISAHYKEYYEQNKDKISAHNKEYYQSPRGQVVAFNSQHRRRTKKQAQGNGITTEQWRECMSFFDWKCAYSGETLTKGTRSLDHIEPLNRGGEHEIWNLVPMVRSLNSSKSDKDMLEWYKGQSFYDPKRLQKIYEWQEYAYNKWGKDAEYFNTNDIQITLL